MRKTLSTFLLLLSIFAFCQKIGYVESYNPNVKHAHFTGTIFLKKEKIQDLDYSIKPFIDSLLTKSQLDLKPMTNFDINLFKYFDPKYGNTRIEKKLKEYCLANNLDGIIIIKSYGNNENKYSVLATVLSPEADLGIVSSSGSKKSVLYYNNIIILYYSLKKGKLKYPVLKKDDNLFYTMNPIRYEDYIYDDDTKNFNNKDQITQDFLKNFKNRLVLNINKTAEELKK